MITPQVFQELSHALATAIGQQARITEASQIDQARKGQPATETLQEEEQRLTEDNLKVLVMGRFSSGKSTFINALMGKDLLPADVKPTTAIIGEILYGDTSCATLYPKPDADGKSQEPFDISTDDLPKYIVIHHDQDEEDTPKQPSPYRKVVIHYPLHICKMGIEFVDSPGLDDPTCHDTITQDYLPQADAIIYCMAIHQAFTARDKVEIEKLWNLGYKSIIFVLTYYDQLEMNDRMYGQHKAEEARQYYVERLKPYTTLGTDGIFAVGSLPALMGKLQDNQVMLDASHMPVLEQRLEEILFDEKGKLKLLKALHVSKQINRETGRYLSDVVEMGRQDRTQLATRLTEAQANLDKAKEKASLISQTFANGANDIIDNTRQRANLFFMDEVLPNVEQWINSFQPSGEEEISMFHPKRSAKAFTQGCLNFFQTKLEGAIGAWCADSLVSDYLSPRLQSLAEQQNQNIKDYENDLKHVRGSLSISAQADDEDQTGNTNRILSAIAGILILNPAAAITGGAFGWSGLLPTLVTTIVAHIIIYVMAFVTGPIGWVAAILTDIAILFVGGQIGGHNVEKRIKTKIAARVKLEIAQHKDEFANTVVQSVKDIIDKIKTAVDNDLNAPVNQYQTLLNEAKADMNTEGKTLENRINEMNRLWKENSTVADTLEDLAQQVQTQS